jgi:hypothetical protein
MKKINTSAGAARPKDKASAVLAPLDKQACMVWITPVGNGDVQLQVLIFADLWARIQAAAGEMDQTTLDWLNTFGLVNLCREILPRHGNRLAEFDAKPLLKEYTITRHRNGSVRFRVHLSEPQYGRIVGAAIATGLPVKEWMERFGLSALVPQELPTLAADLAHRN